MMITNITQLMNASLSTKSLYSHAKKDHNVLSKSLIDLVAKDDPEKAKELLKEQEETQSLLRRLADQQKSMAESRKAAARRRVEEIKKELEMLRMLALTNPEAAARRAKQLAHELKAAVASYGAASSENVSGTVASAEAGANLSTLSNVQTEAGLSPKVAQAEASSLNNESVTVPSDVSEVAKVSEQEEPQNPVTLKQVVEQQVAEQQQKSEKHKADQEFAAEVRRVMDIIKSILETAKRVADVQEDDSVKQDLKSIETQLNAITSSLDTPAITAVNVTV